MSSVPNHRRQLTLFVPVDSSGALEAVRRRLDPIQAALIAVHVTLCREDELVDLDVEAMLERVRTWDAGPILLGFGAPRRFSGHGALLPCEQGTDDFHRLRQWILDDRGARHHDAHITLAHPRNPRAPTNVDAALGEIPSTLDLEFPSVALLEQVDGGPWTSLREGLIGTGRSDA